MTGHLTHPCCFIVPPVILARVAEEGSADQRRAAVRSLATSAAMRSRRSLVQSFSRGMVTSVMADLSPPTGEKRTVYDMRHGSWDDLPGHKARGEGDPPSGDDAVNEAYDGAGSTYDFYRDVFERDSIDGMGMELISSVHYGTGFENAFWQGTQMVYGDGADEVIAIGSLTRDIAVIAHELTHGVTQMTAQLIYSKQSGALNEHFSDVVGSLVKQHVRKEAAEDADWLVGEGVLGPALLPGVALRSMKAPGTAFKFDSQPAHMDDYVDLPDDNDPQNDNGGVHINSGIPNKAFHLVATRLGGFAWEKAGRIWYDTLTKSLEERSQFVDAANATIASAADLFGSDEESAVREAWEEVGIL